MKTLHKIYLMFTLLIFTSSICIISAQSLERKLFASAGNQVDQNEIQFEWSLGEVFVTDLTTNEYIITQGLHQGNSLVSHIDAQANWSDLIKIYPNPAHNILKLAKKTELRFDYHIFNPMGQIVANGTWFSRIHNINIQGLDEGIYILVIIDKDENDQSYKFIKF